MRNIFDKFDQSPIWIRLSVLSMLVVVLVAGLLFVKPDNKIAKQTTTPTSYSKRSSAKASTTDKVAADKTKAALTQTVTDAEEAVKTLEAEQTEANATAAQTAVDKVKDEEAKARLQARIQLVKETMAAAQTSTVQQAPVQQQQPVYQAPAVQTPAAPVEAPTQNPETPSTSTTPQQQQ